LANINYPGANMNANTDNFDIRVFDPRKEENYILRLNGNRTFNAREHSFIAIEISKKSDFLDLPKIFQIDPVNYLIKDAIVKQNGLGFCSLSPVTSKAKQDGLRGLKDMNNLYGSMIGYFKNDDSSVDSIFNNYSKLVTYEEWIIGNCCDIFPVPAGKTKFFGGYSVWSIELLLTMPERVNCLFYYNGEMNMAIFISRIYSNIDNALTGFVRS